MKMILDERGKKYVLKPGEEFQSDLGIIKAEILDNAEIGDPDGEVAVFGRAKLSI